MTNPFDGISVAYSDSGYALECAYDEGLSHDCIIRTSSPALYQNPPPDSRIELIEKDWDSNKIEQLCRETNAFMEDVRDAVRDTSYDKYEDLIAFHAYMATNRMHRMITLRDVDFQEPRAVLGIDFGDCHLTEIVNPGWAQLLASNPKMVKRHYPVQSNESSHIRSESSHSRFDLFRHHAWIAIEFVFWRALWKHIPRRLSRGTVYLSVDNPLARDTMTIFARHGYAICDAGRANVTAASVRDLPEELVEILNGPTQRYLEKWLSPTLATVFLDNFLHRLKQPVAEFDVALSWWDKYLTSERSVNKPVALLSNIPVRTSTLPLTKVCKKHGIPLVLFQHGHSRELNRYMEHHRAFLENNSCDLFMVFNNRARQYSDETVATKAITHAVGVPSVYFRKGHMHKEKIQHREILYVSTYLPLLRRHGVTSALVSDVEREASETAVIGRVLVNIPHRVTIKPYVGEEHFGKLNSFRIAEAANNIDFYEGHADLRYIAAQFRVIVTSRATSTLGWCVMSERPVVYIAHPNQHALWPDAEQAIIKGLFLFDTSEDGALDNLRQFLSQPLEDIERAWEEKAPARQEMIEEFIATGGANAGKRAYRHIHDFITGKSDKLAEVPVHYDELKRGLL